jgi:hypothetical protein
VDDFAKSVFQSELVEQHIRRAIEYGFQQLTVTMAAHAAWQERRSDGSLGRAVEAVFDVWWHMLRTVGDDEIRHFKLERRQDEVPVDQQAVALDFAVVLDHVAVDSFPRIGVILNRLTTPVLRPEDGGLSDDGAWELFHFSEFELLRNPAKCVEQVQGFATVAAFHGYRRPNS